MSETSNGDRQRGAEGARGIKAVRTAAIYLAILAGAAGLVVWIYASEPQAQRVSATKTTAMLVDVEKTERGDFEPRIEGLGTVQAARDIVLSPRVEGRVLEISKNFEPGGFVEKGERLIRIDPADYRNTLEQRKSTLRQQKANLAIELGRREVAKNDYSAAGESVTEEFKSLFLREPQVQSARASIESARAAVEQAELALERTRIEAPFDAQVLRQGVNVGSQVAAGQDLGRLVGTEEYWVMVTLPVEKLDRVAFPKDPAQTRGSPVRLHNRSAWAEGVDRTGRVARLIGSIEGDTRMARILVTVSDPLAREPATQGPELILGSILQARIRGRELNDVVRIDRPHLRQDDTVWVMTEGKLDIREVELAFEDSRHAYIADGLKGGEKLVVSDLATVVEGAPLRTRETDSQNVS